MGTRNYAFGAYTPTTNLASVQDQMIAAHRYRNRLCELERTRRDAADATIRRLSPEYAAAADQAAACDARIEAACEAIKKLSSEARSKVEPTPGMTRERLDAIAAAAAVYPVVKATKAAAFELLKSRQSAIHTEAALTDVTGLGPGSAKAAVKTRFLQLAEAAGLDAGQAAYERDSKAARAGCGCHWGTYLLVEDAASEFSNGAPPNFKRYDGSGAVGVQIQSSNRLTVANALECKDTRLQVVMPNLEELHAKGRSRGKRSEGIVRLRIGSNPNRTPVWTEIPVRFHRLLPMTGDIRQVVLHRRRVGTKSEWSIRFVITEADTPRTMELPGSCVALHLGWRLTDDGLRVASWKGSDGRYGFHVLSHEMLSSDALPASLQAVRDKVLNRKKRRLLRWVTEHSAAMPEWFVTQTETISHWVSQDRFAQLSLVWREQTGALKHDPTRDPALQLADPRWVAWCEVVRRVPGAELVRRLLDKWRVWDKHLLEWLANQRERTIARRDDGYRVLARQLATRYETLVIPGTNYKTLTTRADVGEVETQSTTQRRNARLASPGKLSQFFLEKFAGSVLKLPAQHLTSSCHVCGVVNVFDHRKLVHRCTGCQTEWDQDVNAIENQLERGLALIKVPVLPDSEEAAEAPRKAKRNRRKSQLSVE
jgi:hypothetical protein